MDLLTVLDSSDPDAEFQYETVCNVLKDIGADKNPRLLLLNKIDKTEDNPSLLQTLRLKFPDELCISAKEEIGFVDLKDKIVALGIADEIPASGSMQQPIDTSVRDEAVAALTMLGFSPAPTQKVVVQILQAQPNLAVEQVVKLALKQIK